jgi:hypothetical protein
MRNESQTTLISVVRAAVTEWRRREGWSRETVVDEIVKKHGEINGPSVTGIDFDPHTRDTFGRMKVNAERVFRWLDDETKDCTLLPANFLPSILAALPVDLKLQCIGQILRPLSLEVCIADVSTATEFNAATHASTLIKEGAEAATKILALSAHPSASEVEEVCKEIADVRESACETLRALRAGSVH